MGPRGDRRPHAGAPDRSGRIYPARALHQGLDDDRARLIGIALHEARHGLEPACAVGTPGLSRDLPPQVELGTGAGVPDFVKEEFDAFLGTTLAKPH